MVWIADQSAGLQLGLSEGWFCYPTFRLYAWSMSKVNSAAVVALDLPRVLGLLQRGGLQLLLAVQGSCSERILRINVVRPLSF